MSALWKWKIVQRLLSFHQFIFWFLRKSRENAKNLFYKLLDSAIPLPPLTEPAVRVSWCLVKVVFEACFLSNFLEHVYAITAVALGAVGCSIQTFLNEGRLLSKSETIEYVIEWESGAFRNAIKTIKRMECLFTTTTATRSFSRVTAAAEKSSMLTSLALPWWISIVEIERPKCKLGPFLWSMLFNPQWRWRSLYT